jgi:hypothetical protein
MGLNRLGLLLNISLILYDSCIELLIFFVEQDCGDWISDKCLPSDTRLSRKHHFYPLDTPEVKSCFRISKPKGLFDCKFMANQETGLLEEVKEVSSLAGTRIQSAATGKMAEWSVMTNRALDVNVKNDYYDVEEFERLIYTLYVRMMKHIVSFAEKSATSPHVKPMQLPFHLDNPDYIVNFEGFDLIPRRQFEQRIKQVIIPFLFSQLCISKILFITLELSKFLII